MMGLILFSMGLLVGFGIGILASSPNRKEIIPNE